jgi:flagellar motility protein MotE (MotC chaperone)
MTDTATATTPSRIAHLADTDRDEYDHIVHGVAHGENEFTKGLNGPKYWPAAELENAAPTLEGQAVYKVHGDGDREEVGAVLRAAHQPGLGVVYEAGLNDEAIAGELASGQREVSIEAGNPSDVDKHAETGAVIMRDYEYTGLATTRSGASDANYTAPGSADSNPAVAALSAGSIECVLDGEGLTAALAVGDDEWSADMRLFRVVPALGDRDQYDDDVLGVGVAFPESGVYVDWHTAAFPDELEDPHVSEYGSISDLRKATGNQIVDFAPPSGEWGASLSNLAEISPDDFDVEAALNAYRSEAGVRYRGTRDGKLDKSAIPNDDYEDHFLFDGDTKSASSYPVVDADGYLRRGNVAAAYSVGPRGRASREELYEKLRALNDAFRTPPIDPEKLSADAEEAEMSALAADLDARAVLAARHDIAVCDDPAGASSSGRDTDGSAGTDPGADAGSNTDDATPQGGPDSMTDDNNDNPDVEALLERVDEKDEQIDSLEADLEDKESEIEAKEETIAELEDEAEELREQNEAAREQYAAALAEADTVFDEDELAEKYTLAELSEKIDGADFSDGGDSSPVIRSGGGSGVEANLSGEEQERKAELEERLDELEDKDGALAEKEEERVRAELSDITGGEA